VANPSTRGTICKDRWSGDDGGSSPEAGNCHTNFDGCSDGLRYELDCAAGSCKCFVEGVMQGKYRSQPNDGACDLDIGELKIRCGWNAP
jgi:hypothetical protein